MRAGAAWSKKKLRGGCVAGALLLCACETGMRPPSDLGAPDLLEERAGDISRYLLPSDKPEYVWKPQSIVYYYLDKNLKVTVAKYEMRRELLSDEERRLATEVLDYYHRAHDVAP